MIALGGEAPTRAIIFKKETECHSDYGKGVVNIKVADAIVKMFVQADIPYVFGLAGTTILDLMDTTERESGIEFISARSEDNAAHMADGYARASGKIGICTAHVGPGAVKLIYGVATAYKDGTPMLVITGNEVSKNLGRDSYHEVDISSMYRPITKETFQVSKPEEACSMVARAMALATSGKPGPVHVDLPKDIAAQEIEIGQKEIEQLLSFLQGRALTTPLYRTSPDASTITRSLELLEEAAYPVLFAGAGITRSAAEEELISFAGRLQMPVVTTDGGRGAIPEDHELCLGVVARQVGDKTALDALGKSDLVIGIGLTFSDISTLEWSAIPEEAKIIQVDIDPREVGRQYSVELPVAADAREYLEQLNKALTGDGAGSWDLKEMKESFTAERQAYYNTEAEEGTGVNPWVGIAILNKYVTENTFVSVDIGLHSFFGKKVYIKGKRNYVKSAGLGAMGFSYPSLMGAVLAAPEKNAVTIMGDGGFAMVSHELETVKRLNLPVTCFILNNHRFGSQHYHQGNKYEGRFVGTEFNNPDFAEIARAYGVKSWRVDNEDDLEEIIKQALNCGEPTLIDIQLNPAVVPSNWTAGSGIKGK